MLLKLEEEVDLLQSSDHELGGETIYTFYAAIDNASREDGWP